MKIGEHALALQSQLARLAGKKVSIRSAVTRDFGGISGVINATHS